MHRWAPVTRILLAILTLTVPALAQLMQAQQVQPEAATSSPPSNSTTWDDKSKAEKEKEVLARHQAAVTLFDLVLSGAANLSLPQNRIAIASTAFPVLWTRNEAQARSLVNQMIGDFAQAAARHQESPEPQDRQMLHQQRQTVLLDIAQHDPELALSFMNATRTFVQVGDTEQEEAEERSLRLELAAQEAEHSPRNALRAAEKELHAPGDLNPQLINLLTQISAKDPQAGTQLLHEIVGRIHAADLSSGENNFSFALNLLNTQTNSEANRVAPDDALKTLADAVAGCIKFRVPCEQRADAARLNTRLRTVCSRPCASPAPKGGRIHSRLEPAAKELGSVQPGPAERRSQPTPRRRRTSSARRSSQHVPASRMAVCEQRRHAAGTPVG
jgi:hypothetical protein